MRSNKIVALILAAGESKRLGKPKQLLNYNNTPLLNHIYEHINLENVEQTFIVLGAYANEIKDACAFGTAAVLEFEGWNEGMGSSLAYACKRINAVKKFDGILITLSDLPLVDKTDYQQMIDMFESSTDIVATKANNSLGVPALFGAAYIEELFQLKGKVGAKSIIHKYMNKVKVFDNEKAATDIDTFENYSDLIRPKK